MAKVTIYSSSVSGSTKIRKETTRIENILNAKKIPFESVDAAVDDNKNQMQAISGKIDLPQIVVDGKFVGLSEDLENANEDGEAAVRKFLKLD